MAGTVLGAVGAGVAGPLGAAVGRALGGVLDARLISSLAPARRGPRIETLKVQGTAEGAPMAWVAGRARVTGQVIWAARFLEDRRAQSAGKGGPRTETSAYSLSFAVAICEGEIGGIGRVWADGRAMDLTGVTMRVHRGGEDQSPDPLIEAVEGEAPAYRGVAYAVFEDLALGPYGNRAPQLGFEVFRRPRVAEPALEDLLEGVCLIPGAGEFVLATDAVVRRDGLTRTAAENVHSGDGRPGLVVGLDQLQAQAPNLKRVSLVVGWFGSSTAAHEFTVKPGVERRDKPTEPMGWSVAGLGRAEAHLISAIEGAPAYGGTPSDVSVRQAVAELKGRGLEVTLYPFVFMDCPGYPWRGRVAGRNGAEAAGDVAACFGTADGQGLRRMALHYAALAAETGADGLLIASEMRGLTWTRDAAGEFPAVEQLRGLAAECRAIAGPQVKLSYAADWTEWFGRHDGEDVIFHLDPLWADGNIDHVGIDFYPPLGDWRAGAGGLDAGAFAGPADPAYLAAQVAGGENFDWFYASPEDRAGQVRTPILDAAHDEDWAFRAKDLAGWWSHAHHDRPGGVRSATPTAWVPGMKPIRLTEFGCAAVDRGANAPNLFQDSKSDEGDLPPFSTGSRDDRVQRRALEAVLRWYRAEANNPVSSVYGGRMLEAADAWCWDARPWPAFPARSDLWTDAGAWATGHWLNGRLHGEGTALAEAVLERAGYAAEAAPVDASPVRVDGIVLEGPTAAREALVPLCEALGLTIVERGAGVRLIAPGPTDLHLPRAALALEAGKPAVRRDRRLEAPPATVRARFVDGDADYRTGSIAVRGEGDGMEAALDLAVVCPAVTAEGAARRRLAGDHDGERLTLAPGPLEVLRLEPGDVATVEGFAGVWRVDRIVRDEAPRAILTRAPGAPVAGAAGDPAGEEPADPFGAPFLAVLDLPPLANAEDDARPLVAVAGEPWRPQAVWVGESTDTLTPRGEVNRPATVGVLKTPLGPGVRHRWMRAAEMAVRLEGRAPSSRPEAAVLGGANALAVMGAEGWEVVQFRSAEPLGADEWRLTGLLRGQQGTHAAAVPAGALVVSLEGLNRVQLSAGETGLERIWRAAPAGAPPGGPLAAEVFATVRGVHARPWAPAHLAAEETSDGGRRLSWIARSRLDGDRWEGPEAGADPMRFRVRWLDGETEVGKAEVEAPELVTTGAALGVLFPGGLGESHAAVSQWGERWGWGQEATIPLA
ncbi:baseplate multidomain protein megatron [Brevundimonas fluminis]|uniref:baseplate multidomain protein megatron n=1 Tax=Brevundimonas fluminis TaxID=2487274 RepID=UPI000F65691A|nr:glycoside hydrolase/phage tail family protein [Brevundimonas fluminis]